LPEVIHHCFQFVESAAFFLNEWFKVRLYFDFFGLRKQSEERVKFGGDASSLFERSGCFEPKEGFVGLGGS